jgi:RES domain-containing protein
MPVKASGPPFQLLFRVGRHDPLAWPDWQYVGSSRCDDPSGRFRVLYAGDRQACFLETLAVYRPGLASKQRAGTIPEEWFTTRRMGQFSLTSSRWQGLDLRAAETIQTLRRELRPFLADRGYSEFDASHVLGQDFALTQEIASWTYEQGFEGIIYNSRFALDRTCIAIFEGMLFSESQTCAINRDDSDLIWAADVLGLTIPSH